MTLLGDDTISINVNNVGWKDDKVLGWEDGMFEGIWLAFTDGLKLASKEGTGEGTWLCCFVGRAVGIEVRLDDGTDEGFDDGVNDGSIVGW